jgi:adenine-specific DNA-methyltransferase
MIYIDPPYNTGNDHFIYPDRFSESKDEYLNRIGDKDETGLMTREGLFRKNSKDSGHYHSNWLSMMYPRLFLARNLLRDDGVIFVSIDDNEVHNLRLLMNEVFGEENFVDCITWNKRIPKNDKGIGSIHEYILIYVKNSNLEHKFTMPKEGLSEIRLLVEKLKRKGVAIPEAEKEIKKLYEKKGYDRGITLYNSLTEDYQLWGKINMSWPNADTFGPKYNVYHPRAKKPVKIPDRGWRWKEETFNEALDYKNIIELHDGSFICGKIWFDKDENTQPSSILYLDDVDTLLLRTIVSMKSDGGIEVENIFDGKSFYSYPKPTSLIKTLIQSMLFNTNDIILDFFAGSCTTAHAVLALNKEDASTSSARAGNRKFICVQLPEKCDENSEAFKAGYKTIAEIGKERIRRVIKKMQEEQDGKLDLDGNGDQDLGFKVFKLKESNFKIWRSNIETEEELIAQMQQHLEPLDEHAKIEDVLYELLIKAGVPLTAKINEQNGYVLVNDNEIALMLERADDKIIKQIIAVKPKKVFTLDRLFKNNDKLKTNTALQLKDADIEFKVI